MYDIYIDKIKEEFDFDFRKAEDLFGKIGNAPGIYPDVALLLFRLSHYKNFDSLFESGSGFSTLLFALSAKETGSKFVAIESLHKWLIKTKELLEAYNLDTNCVLFSDCVKDSPNANDVRDYRFSRTNNVIELDFEPDWAWIDGMAMGPDVFEGWNLPYYEVRVMTCVYYQDKLRKSVLIFDDINTPFGDELPMWLDSQNRTIDYVFNPTVRSDRHIGISFPEGYSHREEVIQLIKECELS